MAPKAPVRTPEQQLSDRHRTGGQIRSWDNSMSELAMLSSRALESGSRDIAGLAIWKSGLEEWIGDLH